MLTYFNVFSLSFVIIAQNKFQTTTYGQKFPASEYLRTMFWIHVNGLKDNQGYVTSEGLRIRYKNEIHVRRFYLITDLQCMIEPDD